MEELNYSFFSLLHTAKVMFDSGLSETDRENLGMWALDADNSYAVAMDAAGWIFQDTDIYFNERHEVDTWLFGDPMIDIFCQLCQKYEQRKGISEEENPYRAKMEGCIRENFRFNSYSYGYDWRLSLSERGRKCVLLFTDCEFYSHDELPEALLDIRSLFLTLNQRMEAELAEETRIIPLSTVTAAQRKEAA